MKDKIISYTSWIILDGFFIFLVTEGRLFGIPRLLGMPWWEDSLCDDDDGECRETTNALWNVTLFCLWGLVHSLAAHEVNQKRWSAWMGGFVPPKLIFMAFSALSAFLVQGFWRPMAQDHWVLWDFNPFPKIWEPLDLLTISTYDIASFLVLKMALWHIGNLMTYLSGMTKQERMSGNVQFQKKQLVRTGWYGWVRHPLYTTMLLMMCVTLRMDTARLTTILAFLLYLIPGVYFEEKRLERDFGKDEYNEYRRDVPSKFIPYLY